MRYLLDENVDPALRTTLQRRYPEVIVWIVGDPGAPAYGTLDPDILLWCETNGFALVTNNRASMPVHLRDHLPPDITLMGSSFSTHIGQWERASTILRSFGEHRFPEGTPIE